MMNTAARLGFPSSRTRSEHALAATLLLAACHGAPARLDELAISKLQPGHLNFTDVQGLLGLPDEFSEWPFPDPSGMRFVAGWGPRYFVWDFYLADDGTVRQFSRRRYTWTLISSPGKPAPSAKDSGILYEPPEPVPAECAEHFQPGSTTQAQVVAAWGRCESATALDGGHYTVRWGPTRDCWELQFDADSILAAPPDHYVSSIGKR